ncbi:hemolysin-III related-domain-containing protein [Desarmillaria tabescens]|uniref:Hemolysin-III related-domain-containing protein n=1 Tax=Armillaria tabescens TaxID=1929756 RepID=A0AA39K8X0_ARMTA|nr:hemolysin-III related-domain-containing protein [Desarmillaria tabescens]KAK0455471.1 hemolysin-III related-domain-containing protein [Desarmillaria tabescens]
MDLTSDDTQLRRRRRPSTPYVGLNTTCRPLPYSLEALDLSPNSPTQAMASLRFLVLSYLAELETRLSQLESPDFEAWKVKGEVAMEDANQWVSNTLELLDSIRTDVSFHLPDIHALSVDSLTSHFPDVPNIRSHLPDMSDMHVHLPDFSLSDMRAKLEDIRARFHDIDFDRPVNYLPTLLEHLHDLTLRLSSKELPSGFDIGLAALSSRLTDFLDSILSSNLVASVPHMKDGEDLMGRAAMEVVEVARAIKHSFEGVHLIQYSDLPRKWRNNPFVTRGYRFIPIERWPLLVLSLFAFHNETLNIHTHLIPFLLWLISSIPFFSTEIIDTPERCFMAFALLCLFCSSVWHTMAGCAHHGSMEFCARVDYVGIGWLISASVGTVVWYGFQCHPEWGQFFLSLCAITGLAGNVFPFMDWFNRYENRGWRIAFFLSLAFSSLAPLAAIAVLHSPRQMMDFISPVVPSLISYVAGLVFYATHVPERFLTEKWRQRLDAVGGGSHCIWHCFIVLAVSQHKSAIRNMKEGVLCTL